MIIKKTISFKDIKEMNLDNVLLVEKVHTAILSEDKEALKDLIFGAVKVLERNNIYMEDYYYDRYYPCSDEIFDMFALKTIEELFLTFGYHVETKYIGGFIDDLELLPKGYLVGTLKISKNGYVFSTNIIHTMHDSLSSMFVDVKDFTVVVDDNEYTPLNIVSHNIERDVYEDEILLSLEIEPSISISEDIERQILDLHFNADTKNYICSRVYNFVCAEGDSDEGHYYRLNDKEKEFLRNYIEDNNLDFII